MIFRSEHTENYTVIPNQILNHPTLSWLAIGVLLFLISKPRDFEPNIILLKKHFDSTGRKLGRDTLQKAFRELIEADYIIRKQIKSRGRNYGVSYWVFDVPQTPEMRASNSVPPETENEFPLLKNKENKKIKKTPTNHSFKTHTQDLNKPETREGLVGYFSNREAGAETEVLIKTEIDLGAETGSETEIKSAINTDQDSVKQQGALNVHQLKGSNHNIRIEQSIGKVLTEAQVADAYGMVDHLAQIGIKVSNPDLLKEEVVFSLLDKRSFSRTEHVFSRKLGAIRSLLIQGAWTKPVAMRIKQQRAAMQGSAQGQDTNQKLKDEIRALRLAINSHEQALLGPLGKDTKFANQTQREIDQLRLKLNPLLDQLAAIEAKQEPQAA